MSPSPGRAAAVVGIAAILVGGLVSILFLLGLAGRDTSTRCFANFKHGDRTIFDSKQALAQQGYEPRVSGDPGDKKGSTLRVSVGAEFLSILGLKQDQNGQELEAAMRRLIPDLSRYPCSSEGLNS